MTITLTVHRYQQPIVQEFNSVKEAALTAISINEFDEAFPVCIKDNDNIVWQFKTELSLFESFDEMHKSLEKLSK
jgi:hypothetical protein